MIQIAICDDEQEELETMQKLLKRILDKQNMQYHIDTFSSGEALLEALKPYQLLFLDIAMTGKSGIQTGMEIRAAYKMTEIIYVTNFEDYCKMAVNKVHAFAYINKPVNEEKLTEQVVEVLETIQDKQRLETKPEVIFDVVSEHSDSYARTSLHKFAVEDIVYFEYINRRVRLRIGQDGYYFHDKMMDLTKKMEQYGFALCHQSFLVNLAQVKSVKGYEIYLQNGDVIPLAQRKSAEFRSKLNHYIQCNI